MLNGKLTLGENTADNGGLQVSYMALHKELAKMGGDAATKQVDGYTPDQRFFLGYAQVWCENTREETARMRAKTDSALARPVPHERRGAELGPLCRSIFLQAGRCDGAGQRLPRLVGKRARRCSHSAELCSHIDPPCARIRQAPYASTKGALDICLGAKGPDIGTIRERQRARRQNSLGRRPR